MALGWGAQRTTSGNSVPRIRRVGRLVIAFAALAGTWCAMTAASPRSAQASSTATSVVHVSPLDADGHLRAGFNVIHQYGRTQCILGSFAVGDAYRCFAGNDEIFDPCWVQNVIGPYVICAETPWTHKVIRLHVSKGFDESYRAKPSSYPWAMTLANGLRCVGLQGATGDVDGYGISYGCSDHQTVLLEEPKKTTEPWTIRTA